MAGPGRDGAQAHNVWLARLLMPNIVVVNWIVKYPTLALRKFFQFELSAAPGKTKKGMLPFTAL
jgi:hypothetical protein